MGEYTETTCKFAKAQLDKLVNIKGLIQKDLLVLERPRRLLSVNFPLKMDDGSIRLISAFRCQYNDARGPTKGGLRFHQEVDVQEVMSLAFMMSLKCAVTGIPYGGAKGGVRIDPKELSQSELERLSRSYVRNFEKILGSDFDIPAPDVNTTPQIMAWMLDEYEKLVAIKDPGMITGKPIELGGSLGRAYSTAMGGFFVLEQYMKKLGLDKNVKIAIQGFGNAGYNMARILSENGYKNIIAISDSSSGIYNEKGIDIKAAKEHKDKTRKFKGFKGGKEISNEDVLEADADVLIPAALGGVITTKNADKIKAKLILELANGPIEAAADEILEKKGVPTIPGILANAGGVIVSYYEWVQNKSKDYWDEDVVNAKLKKKIEKAAKDVWDFSQTHKCTLRKAAHVLAVNRIIEAEKLRGNL